MYRGPFRLLPLLALSISAALMAGCTSESTTGPRIVAAVAVSGLGQSGFVGAVLTQPFVVRVEDQNGNPVDGALVSWSVVSGGGTISPSQSVTGSDGVASATLRLGSVVGLQHAKATLGAATPVDFTATAAAAPASQLIVVSGDNQTGIVKTALPAKIVIKTADAFGNVKTGIPVSFTVTAGGGTVNSASGVSDSLGHVSVDWFLGPIAGTQRLTVTSTAIAPLTVQATGLAAAAAKVVILGGTGQSAAPGARLSDSLVIRVVDGFDNPIKDVTVDWAALGDGGSVSPATGKTDAAGRAAASWTLGATGGPKSATAKVGSLDLAQFTAAGTVIFGGGANAGSRHTCGLDEGGVSYCWGYNGDGQLGLGLEPAGSGPVFALPQPTAAAGKLTFAEVDGGRYHTCALTLSNIGYCWGAGVDGRLGDGGTSQKNSPSPLQGTEIFKAISAGRTHSCALSPSGRLFCWGSNSEGQVGNGDPVRGAVSSPVELIGGPSYVSVASGGLHSCAVTAAGAAYCWGYNAKGQLGNSTTSSSGIPALVSGGLEFASITAGENHTCGLSSSGQAYCWGDNAFGQLGANVLGNSADPVAVAGGLTFASLSAGFGHTCGITASGVAYCWGRNTRGELGDGTTTSRPAPVAVGGGLSFRLISAGGGDAGINPTTAPAHTCGVTVGKVAYCWGDNQFGQLGDGTQIMRPLPTKVAFQP